MENNTNMQYTHEKEEQKRPLVSGSNIVIHTEEALQEKRLTISSLIDKLNADVVVGDIVDEFETDRKKSVEEKKELLQKEQDEQEALRRQEIEAQRLAEEAAAAEEVKSKNKKQSSDEDTKKSLALVVTDLSRKAKSELFKNNALKKLFRADDVPELDEEDENEASVEIPEINDEIEKESRKSKKRQKLSQEEQIDDEAEIEIETPKKDKKKTFKKEEKVKQKKEKTPKKSSKKKNQPVPKNITVTYGEEYFDEPIEEVVETPTEQETIEQEETHESTPQRHNGIQEEVRRAHEPTNEDEVYRFCNALERLSDDSYCSVSVYAACIIDKDFKSLSIIKDVSYLAELIADSGYSLDFYFAYIITNRGVQHYGNDEAISEVSLAMETLRTLFIQKKGRVHVEQIQKLPALRIFETIYLEDNNRAMRR